MCLNQFRPGSSLTLEVLCSALVLCVFNIGFRVLQSNVSHRPVLLNGSGSRSARVRVLSPRGHDNALEPQAALCFPTHPAARDWQSPLQPTHAAAHSRSLWGAGRRGSRPPRVCLRSYEVRGEVTREVTVITQDIMIT